MCVVCRVADGRLPLGLGTLGEALIALSGIDPSSLRQPLALLLRPLPDHRVAVRVWENWLAGRTLVGTFHSPCIMSLHRQAARPQAKGPGWVHSVRL